MANGNGFSGPVAGAAEAALAETEQLGMLEFVERFANRGEIDPTRLTEPIRRSMASFLLNRGVVIPGDLQVDAGEFDEYFVTAYEHALGVADGTHDPLDVARQRNATGVDTWDFTVDTFDDLATQGIIRENILAAAAVDYVAELGDGLGVFRLVDALVLNWSSGAIDVVDGASAQRLYRYLRLRDERSTPEERGMLYRRVLGRGSAELLDRMVENEVFPRLRHNLMTEVATFIDKTERISEGSSAVSPVSRAGIYQATRECQYNLTEACTGMAHIQVRELYAQLQEAFDILRDPEIIAHFGGTRRKSMWTVLESLSRTEFGRVPNIGAHRQLAVQGNRVFQWIAAFDEAPSQEALTGFLEAAEAYILASALVEPGEEEDFEEPEFEDEDDFFETEDEDF